MGRAKTAVAQKRHFQVLGLLYKHGADRAEVCLPIRFIADELGLTYQQVRSAVRTLRSEGCISVVSRVLPNGGTTENAYRVTAHGREVLNQAEEVGRPWLG